MESGNKAKSGAPAPEPARQSFLMIFLAVFLPMFIAMMDQTVIASALPQITTEMGNPHQISWIVTAYLIAAAITAPTCGRLGDMFGRKRLMILSIVLFALASIACSLAQNTLTLIVARVAQGLSGGGLITLSNALIGETVSPRERPRFQGYLATISITANMLGPVIGGYITAAFGWRYIFLLNLPLGLLAILFLIRLRAHPGLREKRPFDFVGLGYLALFVSATLLNFSLASDVARGKIWPFIVWGTIATMALFFLIRRENRIRYPLLPVHLVRQRVIWSSIGVAMCHGATFVSLVTFTPLSLWALHGAGPADIGTLMVPLAIGVGVGSIVTGWAVTATGRSAIFPSIGMMIAVFPLLFLAVELDGLGTRAIAAALGLVTFCLGTAMVVVQITVQSAAGPRVLGAAAGTISLARSVGAAIGTGAVSMVFFLLLASAGPDVLQAYPDALNGSPAPGTAAYDLAKRLHDALLPAFAASYLLIACFAGIGSLMAWLIPMRRL